MGSTRMKAGTAQKLVLNMLTTASMIRMGKVFGNLMVDVQATNKKLVERSKRIVCLATGVSREKAEAAIVESRGSVKVAVTLLLTGISAVEAQELLVQGIEFARKDGEVVAGKDELPINSLGH